MTEARITTLPAAPLHVLELWSNPAKAAARISKACGLALPGLGRSAVTDGLTLIRYEPTVWLVEGQHAKLVAALGDDGALTAMGGGIVRVRLSGPRWRRLLMEGGVFDAERAEFAPGCTASTLIDHVNVCLHVVSDDACIGYVPASYAAEMIRFWEAAAQALD